MGTTSCCGMPFGFKGEGCFTVGKDSEGCFTVGKDSLAWKVSTLKDCWDDVTADAAELPGYPLDLDLADFCLLY